LSELTKWIVVAGALGFDAVGVFVAVAPRRVNDVLGGFGRVNIQYPVCTCVPSESRLERSL
jgi:hypothetical protein